MHILGSVSVGSPGQATSLLDPADDIVVYCSNVTCPVSQLLCRYLGEAGYKQVRRYPDGISGWLEAGYPLEGEQIR